MNARHVATLQTALRTKVPVSAGTYEGNVIVASSGTGDARNICVWYVFAEDKQVKCHSLTDSASSAFSYLHFQRRHYVTSPGYVHL